MPRKPFLIVFFSACFLVSPCFILLQASLVTLTPVVGPYNIFAKLSWHDVLVLCLYPLCAASIFFVRRWGWWAFMASSFYLAAANIVVFILRPHYSPFLLAAYTLALTVAAGFFFRRSLIAPYFNPGLRWWEQPGRFGLGIYAIITGRDSRPVQANLVDLSETGVFAVCLGRLPDDPELAVTLHALGHRILTRARVRRRVPHNGTTGYGLQFVHRDPVQATALRALLADFRRAGLLKRERERRAAVLHLPRTAPRFLVRAEAAVPAGVLARPATVLDLSRAGCLLRLPEDPGNGLENGFRLALRCFGREAIVACEPRWSGRLDGVPVRGVAFRFENAAQKRTVRRVIATARRAGASNRLKKARPLPAERIEAAARRTPYRLVQAVKNRILKR